MKRLAVFFLLLSSAVMLMAQGSIKGRALDKQNDEALSFVNVRVDDTSGKMVAGSTTDSEGRFNITGLKEGQYRLRLFCIGYAEASRQFIVTKQKLHHHFPAIYMNEQSKMLREVQVTGQRSQMKLEVDRKTFTVDEVLAAAGGSVSDLLENIPSIEVTTDGEISLRGNSSVEVWINGKASGLTTDNRYEILQQIPAESIERIEVIDNPSAKYSPEGSAGIINIVLKRDRRAGYYGSLQVGANHQGGWNTSGNINYTSGILDAFANVGFRKRRGGGGNEAEQNYLNTQTYQDMKGDNDRKGEALFARAGLTWHASEWIDVGLTGMTLQGKRDNSNSTIYHLGRLDNHVDTAIQERFTTGEGRNRMYYAELNYDHRFGRDTHKLTATLSFNRWTSDDDNTYLDSYRQLSPVERTLSDRQWRPMYIRNRQWEAKVEYENQINEMWKLEAGYNGRFSHENTPQEAWVTGLYQQVEPALVEDTAYFNRFIYDMDVHAAYATLNGKLGRFGLMAGMRGEWWKVHTESYDWENEYKQKPYNGTFEKNYFQLFPSLFLSYELTKTAQLQLNYTRRLRRPWGGQLNSFRNTRDASIVEFGNPQLTPEFTNSFSLNFLKTWDNHTLSIGTYYRPSTDVMQRIRYQNQEDGLMYLTQENVARSQRAGGELILKDKLWRILDLTTTVNAYYYKVDDFTYQIQGQTVTGEAQESFSWDARLLASAILPYAISIQATGNYRSRQAITQGHRKPNASLDLGLRKTFFNKTLAVAVNWRDVFGTRHWENYTSGPTFTRHQKNWRDPRLNIQLTWNFGNMTRKQKPGEAPQQEDNDMQPQYNSSEE
jgi:outer membrane receptor protein involved in Fe transport